MQAIFDAPMSLLQSQQASGAGFAGWQIGQAIDGLLALFLSLFDPTPQAKNLGHSGPLGFTPLI